MTNLVAPDPGRQDLIWTQLKEIVKLLKEASHTTVEAILHPPRSGIPSKKKMELDEPEKIDGMILSMSLKKAGSNINS